MKEYLRLFAKTGLALFCVWHMAAIAIYSIPGESKDRLSRALSERFAPRVAPYVLITSQWQQWNLFSPNPLRRVIFYSVERLTSSNEWQPVATINDRTYGILRHAARFKLLGQAFAEDQYYLPISERAARVFCREFGLSDQDRVRVWRDVAIVPYVHPSPTMRWWSGWTPRYEPNLAVETNCS